MPGEFLRPDGTGAWPDMIGAEMQDMAGPKQPDIRTFGPPPPGIADDVFYDEVTGTGYDEDGEPLFMVEDPYFY